MLDPKTQREVCLTADDFYRVHSSVVSQASFSLHA